MCNLRYFKLLLFGSAALAIFSPGRSNGQTPAVTQHQRSGQTPAAVLNGAASLQGRYEPGNMLRLAFVLTPPHLAEERQFLNDLHDKNSPLFHQYLTAEQWNTRFAPSAADEQAVADWAQSQGFTVTKRFNNRLLVDVEAPSGTIEKAFGIQINRYKLGDLVRFSNDRDPLLPPAVDAVVDSILGLNSFEQLRSAGGSGPIVSQPDYMPGPAKKSIGALKKDASATTTSRTGNMDAARSEATPEVSQPPSGYFTPQLMWASQAYDYGALMSQGHCCNPLNNPDHSPAQTSIALAAYGHLELSDVANFQAAFSYLAYNVETIAVNGGYTCSGAGDNNCGEVTLDTEWSLSMANSQDSARNTAKVYVYEAGSYPNDVVDMYNDIMDDGFARVASTSWGCAEISCWSGTAMNAVDYVFSQMVGEGWTILAASGDQGATAACTDALTVGFPASDPNVTGVGGTKLNGGFGTTYSGASSTYEVAWTGSTTAGSCVKNGGGSTGGVSAWWPSPGYQDGMGFQKRAVPDMALDAFYGHDTYYAGGWAHLGGTSVATPMLAGFFAQENAYLLAIGNKCGASGTSPCGPLGNANYPIYEEGLRHNAARSPFYDILSGCNGNEFTSNLTPYCAKAGYDQVTGWGSANMLQLAWAINWEVTAATGIPSTSFTGPAVNKWYNSNKTVNWSIVDYAGSGGFPGTGIAGFTQGWDSIPADPSSEPHGGSGNSFYSGPQFANGDTGCLAFEPNGCSGGVSQGCHYVHVEGWNNQGYSTGDSKYGPLCYDTVSPTAPAPSFAPTTPASSWYATSVGVTLQATDPGGPGATSGVAHIYYGVNNPFCTLSTPANCSVYGSGFRVATEGVNSVVAVAEDNAGNYSTQWTGNVQIDLTAPVTRIGMSGLLTTGGQSWSTPVTVVLTATDNLSGVASTVYTLDGTTGIYTRSFVISTPGTHSLMVHSVDIAGNVEATQTINFTIAPFATTAALSSSLNPSMNGQAVTLTAQVSTSGSGTPSGTVTFLNGTRTLGSVALSGGIATLVTSALPVGADSLTAVYGGSAGFTGSTSAALSQIVRQMTSTAIKPSSPSANAGQPILFVVSVTGATTGTVQFFDALTPIGTANLSGTGVGTLQISTLSVGSHSITASYAGTAIYLASTSPVFVETINPAP